MSNSGLARERLWSGLKSLTEDVEELAEATADKAVGELELLRRRVQRSLAAAKHTLAQEEKMLKNKSMQLTRATVAYSQKTPWKAAGFTVGAIAVLGLLIWSRNGNLK